MKAVSFFLMFAGIFVTQAFGADMGSGSASASAAPSAATNEQFFWTAVVGVALLAVRFFKNFVENRLPQRHSSH